MSKLVILRKLGHIFLYQLSLKIIFFEIGSVGGKKKIWKKNVLSYSDNHIEILYLKAQTIYRSVLQCRRICFH
jgi:hypothetical protein